MELPRRTRGDELLRPGELLELRQRLRKLALRHDLATVIACAFDHRTRMLPFILADTHMIPAGVRSIGSAMVDAGFPKTRIVLQQWNRSFRPLQMQLDGRVPDVFMVSSMSLHSEQCKNLMRDAHRIDPAHRPLIIAGGPHAVYLPFDLFSPNPNDQWSADVVVTGEEFVLLSLIEVVLSVRAAGETMRSAFYRARDVGALDDIPGLVYPRGDHDGAPEELIDTGIQRLVGDLDELSHPVLGYRLIEPPSRRTTLSAHALPANRIRKLSPISSLVLTFGCKFACNYCPIPAYNQRQHRLKSGERIADEMWELNREYGLEYFFGADDNFFNSKARTLDIVNTLASSERGGERLARKTRWYTEVTVHDTLQMKEHLPLIHDSGCRALWLGVEDLTATLVNKGQSAGKTVEAFQLLRENGICPMPMMMHHDAQPLYSRGTNYGLINQIKILRQAGAVSLQVLMLTPAAGSKLFGPTLASGDVFNKVRGMTIKPHMYDGNYVVASHHKYPWMKQLNMLAGYLYFYNPVWFLVNLIRGKTRVTLKPAGMQIIGMIGLVMTIMRTSGWAIRLMFGGIERFTSIPQSRIPIHGLGGASPSHTMPSEKVEVANLVRLRIPSREMAVR